MIIGIVGLGLIGGSLAKAYKSAEGNTVYGFNRDKSILGFAGLAGAIDGELTEETMKKCDAIFIALYPQASIDYLEKMGPFVPKSAIVFDCCGVKRFVCQRCFEIAERHGFTFVGGHPMAGLQVSGFKNSRANLFKGAAMILVPPRYDDIELFGRIENLLAPAGFGNLTITTAEKHDATIAFTSQMAHVVSNAYIKNPAARGNKGFSAGSYKDLTRVARLNPEMWTELFLENGDALVENLDYFIRSLGEYRDAIAASDGKKLTKLLYEGSRLKEEIDGR